MNIYEPLSPYIYYRFESGHWSATNQFNFLINNRGQITQYFYDINSKDVFNTFCASLVIGGTGNPVRLVFNNPIGSTYNAWKRENLMRIGYPMTIIKIYTTSPLPLAEHYIENVSWTTPRGNQITGCPPQLLSYYSAYGKEFVVQPDQISHIFIYHTYVF